MANWKTKRPSTEIARSPKDVPLGGWRPKAEAKTTARRTSQARARRREYGRLRNGGGDEGRPESVDGTRDDGIWNEPEGDNSDEEPGPY